jgi:hypothetical protein
MSPTPGHYYDEQTYENYRQHYQQQQQTEQQFVHLSLGKNKTFVFFLNIYFSLANNQSEPPPIQSLINNQSQSPVSLPVKSAPEDEEQQLLNAIHAHPHKRDLVLNLLRQMNQSLSTHQQQQPCSPPSTTHKPHSNHSNMEDSDEPT